MRGGKGLALMLVCALLAGCAGTVRMPLVKGGPLVQEDLWVWRDGEVALKPEEMERPYYAFTEEDRTARGAYLGQDWGEVLEIYRDAMEEKIYAAWKEYYQECIEKGDSAEEDRGFIFIEYDADQDGEGDAGMWLYVQGITLVGVSFFSADMTYIHEGCFAIAYDGRVFNRSKKISRAFLARMTEEELELGRRLIEAALDREKMRVKMELGSFYEVVTELDDEDWAIAKRIGETFREEVEAYAAAVEAGEIEE